MLLIIVPNTTPKIPIYCTKIIETTKFTPDCIKGVNLSISYIPDADFIVAGATLKPVI